MKKNKRTWILVCYIITVIAAIFTVFPLYWTLITSFKTYKEAFAQPPSFIAMPTPKNYIEFFSESMIVHYLKNSIIVAIFGMGIPMILGLFAAYSICRSTLRVKEGFSIFLLASRFIPPISTLIPVYLLFRKLGLYDTLLGLVLLNCALNIPFVVWSMRGFIQEIPETLEEAAWIDGASRVRTFFQIILPLCRPGIAATAVLTFIYVWNEFMYAMNLTSSKAKTLPLAMMTYMGEKGFEWQMMATAGITILLPTIVFAIITHRNLGASMSGGVKG